MIVDLDMVRAAHAALAMAAAEGRASTGVGPWSARVEDGWEALLATLHPVFGVDKYPTLAQKAARILHGGTTTQYLLDGNKRLTTVVMLAQLRLNGYTLDCSDAELVEFILGVATAGSADHDDRVGEAAEWIVQHLVLLAEAEP